MEFLKKLLNKDPVVRITVNDALQHPFIKLCNESENIIFDDNDNENQVSLNLCKSNLNLKYFSN